MENLKAYIITEFEIHPYKEYEIRDIENTIFCYDRDKIMNIEKFLENQTLDDNIKIILEELLEENFIISFYSKNRYKKYSYHPHKIEKLKIIELEKIIENNNNIILDLQNRIVELTIQVKNEKIVELEKNIKKNKDLTNDLQNRIVELTIQVKNEKIVELEKNIKKNKDLTNDLQSRIDDLTYHMNDIVDKNN
jgi:hypothetical protein